MQLPASLPEPPEVEPYESDWDEASDIGTDHDHRRAEIETVLEDGAWERSLHEWAVVSKIDGGMADLGRVVSEILRAEYVDWESPFPDPDTAPEEPADENAADGDSEPDSELITDPYARERGKGDEIVDEEEFDAASGNGPRTVR
ncbi:MAG: hypothetical protein ACI9YT_000672 [Halobacteriales archaeon]|jgi:hypothetical protein